MQMDKKSPNAYYSNDILSKYKSLDKYSLVFVLTKMIRKGIAKSQHDALKQLEEGVDLTNLFVEEEPEISTSDEEIKETP
jgi:hypothetical protein|tara:strand:- start:235 stop:474 length:240 start_codon:yes stop_codon:yes gene_type:complete